MADRGQFPAQAKNLFACHSSGLRACQPRLRYLIGPSPLLCDWSLTTALWLVPHHCSRPWRRCRIAHPTSLSASCVCGRSGSSHGARRRGTASCTLWRTGNPIFTAHFYRGVAGTAGRQWGEQAWERGAGAELGGPVYALVFVLP